MVRAMPSNKPRECARRTSVRPHAVHAGMRGALLDGVVLKGGKAGCVVTSQVLVALSEWQALLQLRRYATARRQRRACHHSRACFTLVSFPIHELETQRRLAIARGVWIQLGNTPTDGAAELIGAAFVGAVALCVGVGGGGGTGTGAACGTLALGAVAAGGDGGDGGAGFALFAGAGSGGRGPAPPNESSTLCVCRMQSSLCSTSTVVTASVMPGREARSVQRPSDNGA